MDDRRPPRTTKSQARKQACKGLLPPAENPSPPRQDLRLHDFEMMFVECSKCGRPIVWDVGQTTEYLLTANVNLNALDASCMIVADGCPVCCPADDKGFFLSVVRMTDLTLDEIGLMARPGGAA